MDHIGPQYEKDTPFTARMRFHQSWYRATVLGVPWGTGPNPKSKRELGNMLTGESGKNGLNFLTPEIFDVARHRIEDAKGTVEVYRLLHNMLSSQPMCFNLFGLMVNDHDFATEVFKRILPCEVEKVIHVAIEFAPEPADEFLADRTAFDAFVEFVRPDGKRGFVGIETKLTEPFSQAHYDRPAYRRWVEQERSPWPKEYWSRLDDLQYNQLWRDHLLTVAMRDHPKSTYVCGYLMLVRHPADTHCVQAAQAYQHILKDGDTSFMDYPLDRLLDTMKPAIRTNSQHQWLTQFQNRYLDLMLSEKDWRVMTNKNCNG